MSNFWQKLKEQKNGTGEPFFVLAPMADVTDVAFRRMFAKYGKPDVTYNEFVSADGLCSPGRPILERDLAFSEGERPIVAQLFTSKPENMEKAAIICREMGYDGIDINMGCPDQNVNKQGAGAALIQNPELALEILKAARRGAGDMAVSVKTRVGFNKVELDTWIPKILEGKPDALIIHARTRKEMSLVPARWEFVAQVVEMARGTGIPIIGNGDVMSIEDGLEKAKSTGADGIMVGRGVFGNPFFFNREKSIDDLTLTERFGIMIEHTKLFVELIGDYKNFAIMKKHYKAYVKGFDHASDLRVKLMESNSVEEIESHVASFLLSHPDMAGKTVRELLKA